MAGVVVVNGRFEPGSVVKLLRVKDEAVLRAEGGELVGERVVDGDGVVGWDGVDVGASYFACGYVDGGYLELRCRGVDVADPNAALTQAPTPAPVPSIGTQGAPNVEAPPEPPAVEGDAEPLPVGLPDGVSLPTLGVKTYYLHNSDAPASPDWHRPDLQAPAETAADGTVLDARPLYEWAGEGEPDLGVGTGEKPEWEAYEGPTEPAGAQSDHTDVSGEPPVEPAADAPPPVSDPAPPEADVPPVSGPVPSESAGTGEQAGAPSEELAVPGGPEVTVSAPSDVSVEATPDVQITEPNTSTTTVDPSTAPTEGTPAQPDETAPATATDAGGEAPGSEPPAQESQPDASQPEPPVAAPETPVEPAPADPAAPEAPAPDQPAPAPEAAPAADAPAAGGADTNPPA